MLRVPLVGGDLDHEETLFRLLESLQTFSQVQLFFLIPYSLFSFRNPKKSLAKSNLEQIH